ncbi:MAG TPA: response regulator [Actinomycetota bacterium]|nr:response regulator [Actinomycetota bacterium]
MAGRRPLVLIVEDEPDMLLLLRLTLEEEGFDTCLAADGATALRRVDEDRPDVVLLDLMLPVLDGWGVLAELRARRRAPPVVVCSALDGAAERRRAAELGAATYVTKPFEVGRLLRALREVLPGRGAAPEAAGRSRLGLGGAAPA